jgi:hypothetical protein
MTYIKGGKEMKKFLPLLMGGLLSFGFFVAAETPVKAAELTKPVSTATTLGTSSNGDCGCDVSPILGSERNKMVSDLIKTDAFKTVKHDAMAKGYIWQGAGAVQVIKNNKNGVILIGAPFQYKDGSLSMFVFINGQFVGTSPM